MEISTVERCRQREHVLFGGSGKDVLFVLGLGEPARIKPRGGGNVR